MAKPKRDLDAELAALEAELAAVQSKARSRKAPAPAAPPPEVAQPTSIVDERPVVRDARPEAPAKKRSLFSLPQRKPKDALPEAPAPKRKLPLPFGRKKENPFADALQTWETTDKVVDAPPPRPEPAPAVAAAAWRQEGAAWVRAAEREAPVVRRVLDEEDRMVREEAATHADVDAVTGVRAERGVGRLLGRSG